MGENMLNKKVLTSRKAISPILATLLLIVIAVAAIVVTYAWIMTYMSSAGQHAGVIIYEQQVNFVLGTPKTIEIYIGNSGTSDTNIIKVYMGTSDANRPEQTPTQTLPLLLLHGSVVKITLNYNWTAQTTYHFRISTDSGQNLDFQVQASS
jgi:flagellin-like protein